MPKKSLPKPDRPNLLQSLERALSRLSDLLGFPSSQQFFDISKSPNLLFPINPGKAPKIRYKNKLVYSANLAVLTVATLFLLLLMINSYLDLKLDRLRKQSNEYLIRINEVSEVEEKASELSERIALHKKYNALGGPIAVPMKEITEDIDTRGVYTDLSYDRSKHGVNFKMTSKTPTDLAYLLSDFLDHEYIDSIVLKSVELTGKSDNYSAEINLVLKEGL